MSTPSTTGGGVLWVRLEPDLKRAIESIAEREDRTQAYVVRRILREHVSLPSSAEVSHAG